MKRGQQRSIYVGLVHWKDGASFGVSFPDFPGCITIGQSIYEAQRLAQKSLISVIHGMRKNGVEVPAPRSMETIMRDTQPDLDGIVAILDVEL